MEKKFLLSLEKYLRTRIVKVVPFSFGWVIVGSCLVVIISSLLMIKGRKSFLQAGEYPFLQGKIENLAKEIALKGDYEKAQEIYENSMKSKGEKVLGSSSSLEFERVVYPERYMKRLRGKFEEFLVENPYYLDGIVVLEELYGKAGEMEKKKQFSELKEWVRPDNN